MKLIRTLGSWFSSGKQFRAPFPRFVVWFLTISWLIGTVIALISVFTASKSEQIILTVIGIPLSAFLFKITISTNANRMGWEWK